MEPIRDLCLAGAGIGTHGASGGIGMVACLGSIQREIVSDIIFSLKQLPRFVGFCKFPRSLAEVFPDYTYPFYIPLQWPTWAVSRDWVELAIEDQTEYINS